MARADAPLLGLRCDVFDHIATPPIARSRPHFAADQYPSGADEADNLGLPSYAKLEVLVAYLTSRNVVRSEAMREFFMTFRLFTSTIEVWDILCARLLWAARQAARTGGESEMGNDVGTRCFVLLRHWIREYFREDFLKDADLRVHAADILTSLSGLTELVFSVHFRRIHAQLRRAWVEQVDHFWPLSAGSKENDDAPVPAGGTYNPEVDTIPDTGLVGGKIPIDADIGVPVIRSSPQRARPKPKLSLLFGRGGHSRAPKNNEAVLHNKVDFLALRVIDEYHGMLERQAKAQAQAQAKAELQTRASIPSMLVPETSDITDTPQRNALDQPAPQGEPENTSLGSVSRIPHSTGLSNAASLNEPEISLPSVAPPLAPKPLEMTAHHSARSLVHSVSTMSSTSTTSASEFRTPTPSLFGNEEWTTPQDSPTSMEETRSIAHEKSMDTLDMDHMVLANTSGESEMSEDEDDGAFVGPASWGPIDVNDFERVSYSGSSLSTLSIARESTFSYHGDRASVPAATEVVSGNQTQAPLIVSGSSHSSPRSTISGDGERVLDGEDFDYEEEHESEELDEDREEDRQEFGQELEQEIAQEDDHEEGIVNNTHEGSDQGDEDGADNSHDLSLLSEQDNSELQPCAGYTSRDAAQLQAIPDDVLVGDALGATLQMLEGTYVRVERARATQAQQPADEVGDDSLDMGYGAGIPRSNTAELYAQAFASSRSVTALANDVDELRIPAPHGVDAILNHVREVPEPVSRFASESVPVPAHHIPNAASRPTFAQPMLHLGAPGASHAPFVLSYTARAVAEQMTLIEKDILSQIDWRELVEARWPTTELCADSWLHVLESTSDATRGVGLITSRFELVCAWVRSELILCESPALKAQAFSRFVHIAFEALRLQNFTTMVQLVLGLTSETVRARLGDSTLKLLSESDRDTLERLEALASPSRNYAALRETHRRLSHTKGCIPFTPMFLGDLAANASVGATNAENEIHFGKYRTTAQVVQKLQRCVVRSQSYNLEPQQAVLSKCLYISKLTADEELRLSNI